jgi:hypothetical protein
MKSLTKSTWFETTEDRAVGKLVIEVSCYSLSLHDRLRGGVCQTPVAKREVFIPVARCQ